MCVYLTLKIYYAYILLAPCLLASINVLAVKWKAHGL